MYLFIEFKQRVHIWISLTDSFCCTNETNITLKINYNNQSIIYNQSIVILKIKKKEWKLLLLRGRGMREACVGSLRLLCYIIIVANYYI